MKAQSTSRTGRPNSGATSRFQAAAVTPRQDGSRRSDALADDQVVARGEGQEVLELGEVELQVGVGQQHPRLARGPIPERSAAP